MLDKIWLVDVYQQGICPVCLRRLIISEASLDHDHECVNRAAHKTQSHVEYGCKRCIRGAVHNQRCNWHFLGVLERYPHLQNDFTRAYLRRRPFDTV